MPARKQHALKHFLGKQLCHFCFCLTFKWDQPRSKFFPVREGTIWKGFVGRSKQEVIRARALDMREYLVMIRNNEIIFCKFCIKMDLVNAHLNRLDETVQVRGHNIWFG